MFPVEELNANFFSLGTPTPLDIVSFLKLNLTENLNVLEIRSGVAFNLTFFITDKQDNILIFDDFSHGAISVFGAFKYQLKIENGVAQCEKGWFNFTNVRVYGWPDSVVQMEISFNIPAHIILNPDPISFRKSIYIHFKPCVLGEIVLFDMQCYECPSQSFSSEDPMLAIKEVEQQPKLFIPVMKCSACLKNALCTGGWVVFPLAGYWRVKNSSSTIIDCLISEACIGYDPTRPISENLIGTCRVGHKGNLCYDCIKNYGKLNSNFLCEKCEDVVEGAYIRLSLLIVLTIAYMIFGSYLYSQQSEKEENVLIVYLRIGISFSQITALFSFLKVNWPNMGLDQIISMNSSFMSMTSEDLMFNECIIHQFSMEGRQFLTFKMVISISLPLILLIVSSFIWIIFLFIKYRTLNRIALNDFYNKIFASLIISLFLLHPSIIKTSFSMLNCFVLDATIREEEFLNVSPNFKCWDSYHLNVIIFTVLPGILVWGVGFPLGLLYFLLKKYNLRQKSKPNKLLTVSKDTKINAKHKGVASDRSNNCPPSNLKISFSDNSKVLTLKRRISSADEGQFKEEYDDTSLSSTIVKSISKSKGRKKNFAPESGIFQFFCEGFKKDYYYWECLIFLKKFLLSLLINFTQMIGFEMTSLLILAVLFLHLFFHTKKKPYDNKYLNYLEHLCLVGSISIFFSMLILHENISDTSKYLFSLVVLISYSICFGCMLYFVFMALKRTNLFNKILNVIGRPFRRRLRNK